MAEQTQDRPGEAPGSFVQSDAGIDLPTERTHATPGRTFEEIRDNEQLGRTRELMLHEVQDIAPPAAGDVDTQTDQTGRQGRSAERPEGVAGEVSSLETDEPGLVGPAIGTRRDARGGPEWPED